MKKLSRRLFLFAFLFAVLAAGAAYVFLSSLDEGDETVIEMATILVAAENIPPRTLVVAELIKEIEVPAESVYGNFINDPSEIIGKYVKEGIYADEQFHKDKLLGSVDEELSLKIAGNQRAVSINVNGESGVAKLLKPGDRVDVIMFLPELKENQRIVRPDVAKILLQNVEILAIDKDLTYQEEIIDEEAQGKEEARFFITTLSVHVQDVERLVLAEDIGTLELALRPLEGDYLYATEGVIWQELLIDDFNKMKDMFPTYDIKGIKESLEGAEESEGTYDKYIYYTVAYGDTLGSIARKFYGDTEKYILIQQVNRIDDEDLIVVGTGIKIPVLDERGDFDGQN